MQAGHQEVAFLGLGKFVGRVELEVPKLVDDSPALEDSLGDLLGRGIAAHSGDEPRQLDVEAVGVELLVADATSIGLLQVEPGVSELADSHDGGDFGVGEVTDESTKSFAFSQVPFLAGSSPRGVRPVVGTLGNSGGSYTMEFAEHLVAP